MKELDLVRVRLVKESAIPYCTTANSPEDAVLVMRDYLEDLAQEAVVALYISAKGKVLNASILSMGTIDHSMIDPRLTLTPALLSNAAGMILMHNHPSGDPTPSAEDYQVTERILKACCLMGIAMNDHIIVGERTYFSFYESGYDFQNGGDSK